MWQTLIRAGLAAKAILELTVAWEVATAGQIVTAICVGTLGIAPHLWTMAKKFVDGSNESSL
jgi:hypothetical protein